MPFASFELQIADYDVFAFLQAQPMSGKFNPLATTIDGLVRRHVQVRGEINGAGHFKHNPQWFFSATRLTQRPRSIICERCDAVKGAVEATNSEAAEALGLGSEGAEGGVDVGVRKREHVGISYGWWWGWEWWRVIVYMGRRNEVGAFAMAVSMGVTHF
ncbi:hypothetical protein V8G54_031105 [Vigna mungo]|uniref:Uncharacterized protein n=1 Tax=Vigna mungo TaxID=3915 RepID=A0AAQ3MY80_VIGMU